LLLNIFARLDLEPPILHPSDTSVFHSPIPELDLKEPAIPTQQLLNHVMAQLNLIACECQGAVEARRCTPPPAYEEVVQEPSRLPAFLANDDGTLPNTTANDEIGGSPNDVDTCPVDIEREKILGASAFPIRDTFMCFCQSRKKDQKRRLARLIGASDASSNDDLDVSRQPFELCKFLENLLNSSGSEECPFPDFADDEMCDHEMCDRARGDWRECWCSSCSEEHETA
jgi:hypothetical protein